MLKTFRRFWGEIPRFSCNPAPACATINPSMRCEIEKGGYAMKATEKTMDTIVNLCKTRGFIFPGSEIYGGLSNSWDYGPLGVEFNNNVKKAW